MRQKYYVGVSQTSRIVFKSATNPTEASHGKSYRYVVGPFDTRGGAVIMARYGANNPHLQVVSEAEYHSKKLGARWYKRQGFQPNQSLSAMEPVTN